jgi:hypothetical protein
VSTRDDWSCRIDSPLVRSFRVGGGSALYVSGHLFHRRSPLRSLVLRHAGVAHPIRIHSMPRLDVFEADGRPGDRPLRTACRSGFWAVLPVAGVTAPTESTVVLDGVTRAGDRLELPLGEIRLLPAAPPPAVAAAPGLVVICMATFEPDLSLFRRQVESIRRQTHESWRCIVGDDGSRPETFAAMRDVVGDDDRFDLRANTERLGFYFNFERVLAQVPAGAEAVALCDQDDEWHPAKIATLLAELRAGHTLAYSDQRIVRPDGGVLAPTYWGRRENQWRDLPTLVAANTVTGAASLFRRELLDVALPFPPRLGGAYHDHWIAAVARAAGTIGYVDEPLYDYVQHGEQVLGHALAKAEQAHGGERLLRWQVRYFTHVVPPQLAAAALVERCGAMLDARDRRRLDALAAGDATVPGTLARFGLVPAVRRVTDGEQWHAPAGMLWRRWCRLRARVRGVDHVHSVDPRPSYADYGPS